jgi:hypothetical protein
MKETACKAREGGVTRQSDGKTALDLALAKCTDEVVAAIARHRPVLPPSRVCTWLHGCAYVVCIRVYFLLGD